MATTNIPARPQLSNIEGLRAAIEASPFDAVVAVSPDNFPYVAGCFVWTQVDLRERLAIAVWCKGGSEPTLVVCNIETPYVREKSWVEDIREYVEFKTSPIEVLADLFKERGLDRGKIGVELTYLMAHYYDELRERLPRAEIGRSEEIFDRVRAVKTPAEIELLRFAANSTERALMATYATAQEGDVERDLVARLGSHMLQTGADRPAFLYLTCGPNSGMAHPDPTDYRIKRGDLIKSDTGGYYSGYRSDVGRTGVVGAPSDEQRRIYENLVKIHRESVAMMRAGTRACDVFNRSKAAYEKHGIPFRLPHQGHGIGIATHERPILNPYDEWVLEPNMMFYVETRVRWPGKEGYHIEDLVQVTDGDPIVHTTFFPRDELFRI